MTPAENLTGSLRGSTEGESLTSKGCRKARQCVAAIHEQRSACDGCVSPRQAADRDERQCHAVHARGRYAVAAINIEAERALLWCSLCNNQYWRRSPIS